MCLAKIKDVLNPKIIKAVDQGKCSVKLKEDDPGSKFPGVVIEGLHRDSVVFKLDIGKKGFKKKSPYLSDKKGLHAGCDYVIATKLGNEHLILLCELKSESKKRANAQLLYSTPFIDYLFSLLKVHHDLDLKSDFKPHYIVFATRRLNKKRTRPMQEPEKIKYQHLLIKIFKNQKSIYLSEIVR